MEILNTTITARATANYEVGEVSIQISNYTESEFVQIQQYAIDKAVGICNELQAKMGVKPETPKVESFRQPTQTTPRKNSYMTNQRSVMTQDGVASGTRITPPSQKQVDYLFSLGYQGAVPATAGQCYSLIESIKKERGII